MKNITVYCGSKIGTDPIYKEAAESLGKWIAQNGLTLVYGGGSLGLMGTVANSVIENGGSSMGIIPKLLVEKEQAHSGVSDLIIVQNMSERKNKMLELGDAYITLPGGPGSIEEISEAISAVRLGIHSGKCILLNINHYYDDLLNQYDKMVSEGFLPQEQRDILISVDTVDALDKIL